MAVLENKSAFPGLLVPAQDARGQMYLVVLVRGTFRVERGGETLLGSEQDPVCLEDVYFGEPGKSSVKFASDFALRKQGTDVALIGTAYAPGGQPATQVIVELSLGPLKKRVLVFGDRVWIRTLGLPSISEPRPFLKMPLVYERAFGGSDTSHADPAKHRWELRNPIGAGFRAHKPISGLALPNIEDPAHLIHSPGDRPTPQGFGFIDRTWEPRSSFKGTFDEVWLKEQCPLLPIDFDDRFFCAAHPDLVCNQHLAGDESVRIVGAVPEGALNFSLPGLAIGVAVHERAGRVSRGLATVDTVVLRPDERRFNMVWRYTILCSRKIFDIERVVAFPIRLKTALALIQKDASVNKVRR